MINMRIVRLFIVIVLFCGNVVLTADQQSSSVTISVIGARSNSKNANGQIVYEVLTGKDFRLIVVSAGLSASSERPLIDGIDKLENSFLRCSISEVNINGKITRALRFEYAVVGSEEGEYEIGPAKTINGVSEKCIIRVRQPSIEESNDEFQKAYQQGAPCQARLITEKKEFFHGEVIPVTLEIYCWNPNVEIEQLQTNFDGFSVKESDAAVESVEIDGRSVKVIQKKYYLTSLWPGPLKIKPTLLLYNIPSEQDDFFLGGMRVTSFMGLSRNSHRVKIETNGLEVLVKELPKTTKRVDAIGTFSSLALSLDRNSVDVLGTIKLSLRVIGNGSFDQIDPPKLKLPKNIRSFSGAEEGNVIKRGQSDESEKRFTYIIQPLKPGAIKIPEQEFYYFDTSSGEYKTLRSNSMMIFVDGDPEPAEKAPEDQSLVQPQAPLNGAADISHLQNTQDLDFEIEGIKEDQNFALRGISFYAWIVLAVLSFLMGYFFVSFKKIIARRRRNPRIALKIALNLIDQNLDKNIESLFVIAIDYCKLRLFNDRIKTPTLEDIQHELERSKCSQMIINSFMQQLNSLAAARFGFSKSSVDYKKQSEMLKKILTEIEVSF
jgi:hypothetical protein